MEILGVPQRSTRSLRQRNVSVLTLIWRLLDSHRRHVPLVARQNPNLLRVLEVLVLQKRGQTRNLIPKQETLPS